MGKLFLLASDRKPGRPFASGRLAADLALSAFQTIVCVYGDPRSRRSQAVFMEGLGCRKWYESYNLPRQEIRTKVLDAILRLEESLPGGGALDPAWSIARSITDQKRESAVLIVAEARTFQPFISHCNEVRTGGPQPLAPMHAGHLRIVCYHGASVVDIKSFPATSSFVCDHAQTVAAENPAPAP